VSEFDLAYPVLVARVVALLALVLVITCVGQIGAAPYDWWLRRYLHRKLPTGPIPGGAVVSSVVVFGLAWPLASIAALLLGILLTSLVLKALPASLVPSGVQGPVAWSVFLLVAFTALASILRATARGCGRAAARNRNISQTVALSPQTRIISIASGLATVVLILAYAAVSEGSSAASALRTRHRGSAVQELADEQALPDVECVQVTWIGPRNGPSGLNQGVLYLGSSNDQVSLYSKQQHHAIWRYTGDVTMVCVAC